MSLKCKQPAGLVDALVVAMRRGANNTDAGGKTGIVQPNMVSMKELESQRLRFRPKSLREMPDKVI